MIHDPGPPTLPRTWRDRVVETIVLGALLFSASVALAADVVVVTPSVAPGATARQSVAAHAVAPTPAERYVECQYCHFTYLATVKDGQFIFKEHDFARLALTTSAYFETCSVTYFKHIGSAVYRMRELGSGRIVETKDPKAKP